MKIRRIFILFVVFFISIILSSCTSNSYGNLNKIKNETKNDYVIIGEKGFCHDDYRIKYEDAFNTKRNFNPDKGLTDIQYHIESEGLVITALADSRYLGYNFEKLVYKFDNKYETFETDETRDYHYVYTNDGYLFCPIKTDYLSLDLKYKKGTYILEYTIPYDDIEYLELLENDNGNSVVACYSLDGTRMKYICYISNNVEYKFNTVLIPDHITSYSSETCINGCYIEYRSRDNKKEFTFIYDYINNEIIYELDLYSTYKIYDEDIYNSISNIFNKKYKYYSNDELPSLEKIEEKSKAFKNLKTAYMKNQKFDSPIYYTNESGNIYLILKSYTEKKESNEVIKNYLDPQYVFLWNESTDEISYIGYSFGEVLGIHEVIHQGLNN